MEVQIGYREDIDRVVEILQSILAEMKGTPPWSVRILDQADVLGVQNFGESSMQMRILVKTLPGWQWATERELRARIRKRFDAEGIEIPLPQRVIHHVQAPARPAAPSAAPSAPPSASAPRTTPAERS